MNERRFLIEVAAVCAVMLAMAGVAAPATLKPPLAKMAWLLGSWSCQQTDWDTGSRAEQSAVRYVSSSDGLTIYYRVTAAGGSSSGRLTWNEETARFLVKSTQTNENGEELGALLAARDDVTANQMVFVGFHQMSRGMLRVRVTTLRTGYDTFTESSDQRLPNGTWTTIATNSCRRTT